MDSHSPAPKERNGPPLERSGRFLFHESLSAETRSRRVPKGMSLVELAIVLTIVSIIAVAAVPSLDGALSESRLAGAADQVITALSFAQLAAAHSGHETRVTFDTSAKTILVEQFSKTTDLLGNETELDEAAVEAGSFEPMAHPLRRGEDYRIDLSDQGLLGGVDIETADFGGNHFVVFDALGVPSTQGTVTLALGSRVQKVRLRASSGRAALID